MPNEKGREIKISLVEPQEAILTEYRAMREELMFFLSSQRRAIYSMMTVVFGQVIVLFVHEKSVASAAHFLVFVYLFIFPILIFSMMIIALDCTAKVILAADYIHHNIRKRLLKIHGCDAGFLDWEIHKKKSNRINKNVLFLLDMSKWVVYSIGFIISFALSIWIALIGKVNLPIIAYVLGGALDVGLMLFTIVASVKFNESKGEACNDIEN
ncbi:MAG: hypothetical protein ACYCS0_01260 [bacterium]